MASDSRGNNVKNYRKTLAVIWLAKKLPDCIVSGSSALVHAGAKYACNNTSVFGKHVLKSWNILNFSRSISLKYSFYSVKLWIRKIYLSLYIFILLTNTYKALCQNFFVLKEMYRSTRELACWKSLPAIYGLKIKTLCSCSVHPDYRSPKNKTKNPPIIKISPPSLRPQNRM